jgi:hypothetical protein
MDLPPATPQNKDVPQETGGTPNPTGAHTVKVKSKTAAAVGPRENMPDRSLFARATTAMESKPMGVGGFFRVLWNYTSNYSTKSWGQARLDGIDQEELKAVIEDYLKDNPREVGKIMREITSNTESQDPRIVQAFAEALKKVNPKKFEILCKRVKNQINIVLEQGSQTSSGITQDNIKHAVDLVNQLKSVIKFSQPALALHSLARRLPADQITPDLIAFCNVFPKKAQILAKRQDFQLTSFRGTNCDDGMLLMYKDSGYDPKILDLIDAELFEGDRRDTRIESFLADPAVKSNLFWIDGIQRHSIPHITLPNGVEILSNKWCDSSEYCKSTGEPYDQAKYLSICSINSSMHIKARMKPLEHLRFLYKILRVAGMLLEEYLDE